MAEDSIHAAALVLRGAKEASLPVPCFGTEADITFWRVRIVLMTVLDICARIDCTVKGCGDEGTECMPAEMACCSPVPLLVAARRSETLAMFCTLAGVRERCVGLAVAPLSRAPGCLVGRFVGGCCPWELMATAAAAVELLTAAMGWLDVRPSDPLVGAAAPICIGDDAHCRIASSSTKRAARRACIGSIGGTFKQNLLR